MNTFLPIFSDDTMLKYNLKSKYKGYDDIYDPAIFSDNTMHKYNLKSKREVHDEIYDPKVNPTIMNVFSSSTFR